MLDILQGGALADPPTRKSESETIVFKDASSVITVVTWNYLCLQHAVQ
jgi:hypothetical protein